MNTIAVILLAGALAVWLGNALWHTTLIRQAHLDAWRQNRLAARRHKAAEIAMKHRIKARIRTVGELRIIESMLGTQVQPTDWEFEDTPGCEQHSHLPDGRCLFHGYTGTELIEIHKQKADFCEGPWNPPDPDAWRNV